MVHSVSVNGGHCNPGVTLLLNCHNFGFMVKDFASNVQKLLQTLFWNLLFGAKF